MVMRVGNEKHTMLWNALEGGKSQERNPTLQYSFPRLFPMSNLHVTIAQLLYSTTTTTKEPA